MKFQVGDLVLWRGAICIVKKVDRLIRIFSNGLGIMEVSYNTLARNQVVWFKKVRKWRRW